MTLRAAVVGLGHLGRHHARLLHQLPGVKLVSICDLLPAKFDQPECPPEVPRTRDARAAWQEADLVVVATPTASHAEVALPALRAGLDVLVEKPLAATASEGRALLEAARDSGAVLHTGHSERFNSAYRAVGGRLQDVRFVEGHRLAPFTPRSLDVDVVLDLMVHDLDLALHAVRRPVERVEAVGVPVISPHVDIANARLVFAGGCVANLTASRVSAKAVRKLRFFDHDAYWSLDFIQREADVTVLERPADGPPAVSQRRERLEGEPLRLELEDFVAACAARRGGPAHLPAGATGEEGMAALELALRVREAIALHADRFGPRQP
ncbi:MAG: Gfo/Idh/MocA family oxidoreductase [Candidatus Eisenbacteria bacterium]|nr:Gfo/Idh/MocA family oxidoreductase [Candidatus Eisenbacteria bacterium]